MVKEINKNVNILSNRNTGYTGYRLQMMKNCVLRLYSKLLSILKSYNRLQKVTIVNYTTKNNPGSNRLRMIYKLRLHMQVLKTNEIQTNHEAFYVRIRTPSCFY